MNDSALYFPDRLWWYFGFVVALGISGTAVAQPFIEVRCTIEATTVAMGRTNGEPRRPMVISSLCVFNGRQWYITNDFIRNSKGMLLFDGTNLIGSTRITQAPKAEKQAMLSNTVRIATVPFERARSNVTVTVYRSADGNPMADRGVNIPWLAFCSGQFLRREGRLIPLMAETLRHCPDAFGYADETTTFNDPLGLPRMIKLRTSRKLYEASTVKFHTGWGDRYIPWDRRTAASLEEGVLMLEYEVTAFTNFLGSNIPLEFRLKQYPRPYMQNGVYTFEAKGTVTSLRQAESRLPSAFDPELQQTIVDYRLGPGDPPRSPLIYRQTNATLLPINSPELLERERNRTQRAGEMRWKAEANKAAQPLKD